MNGWRRAVALGLVALGLVFPAYTLGQGPEWAYDRSDVALHDGAGTATVGPGSAVDPGSVGEGGLPFTGLDAILLAAAGAALAAFGLGMRLLAPRARGDTA